MIGWGGTKLARSFRPFLFSSSGRWQAGQQPDEACLAQKFGIIVRANGRSLDFAQSIMRGDRHGIILQLTTKRTAQAAPEGSGR